MSLKPGKPQPPFGQDVIKTLIPHRAPMLMVTQVSAVGEGWIEIEHALDPSAPFFAGHFPKRPIMPGVLIIETIAQAGALLIDLTCDLDPALQFMAFTSVEKAKFRRPAQPGETLCIRLEIARNRGRLYKFEGIARIGEEIAAQVDFTASIMDF